MKRSNKYLTFFFSGDVVVVVEREEEEEGDVIDHLHLIKVEVVVIILDQGHDHILLVSSIMKSLNIVSYHFSKWHCYTKFYSYIKTKMLVY